MSWLRPPLLSLLLILAGSVPALAQSVRPGWGALPYADAGGTGVTFRLWAPAASSVAVAGTFNGWSSSAHPLTLESATTGVWSADVTSARTNDNYKYVVNGTLWRSDPRSRVLNTADSNNSVITGTNSFAWNGDTFSITNASDLVIYEAHVGALTGPGGTFTSFSNRLDYLRDLGISAIELMPINEFPSATSWGYNPAYPFALETSYGTPAQLKSLVQSAHRRGLVMLLDVVHNHWDGNSALWQLDGSTPGPYFYPSDPYTYTPWGPRPDYRNAVVRDYINDSFRMWLDEYHISGFRWDAPKHIIYTTNNVYIPDGMLMVTNALNLMAAGYPGTWNIAEDTKEISGFNYFWDFTFNAEIKSVLTQSDDNLRDMPTVARNVNGITTRILYTDSHDTAGDLNGGIRLPTAIHSVDPAGYYARKRSALGAALMMTAPGTPMILQGQELLETNQFSDTRSMDWSRTNSQAGTLRLYRDLIRLRRNLDGTSAGLLGDAVSTYLVDNSSKLVAYSRWSSTTTGNYTVVVANFANTTRSGYSMRFPEEGTWYTLFNSDSTNYAPDYAHVGSAEVAVSGDPPTGSITIAPYSVLILSRTPRSGMLVQGQQAFDQAGGNNNGVVDPGETIRSRVVLWNKSQLPASNVTAQLVSLTPGVEIVDGQSTYLPMAPDATSSNDILFAYRVSPTQACGSAISLQLITTFNQVKVTNLLEQMLGEMVQVPPSTNRFTSTDTPVLIPDTSTVYSVLNISQAGTPVINDINVQVRLNHTYDRDVTLALQHPDGTEVLLVRRRGGSGDNFGTGTGNCDQLVYTVFDQSATRAISNSTAPFASGPYRPEATLNILNGKPLNGSWRLRMRDETTQDTGTNLCWGIVATYEQQYVACTVFSNRPPVGGHAQHVLTQHGSTNLHLSASDPDGEPVTLQLLHPPAHGLLTLLDPTGGLARYQPVYGFHGTDTFDFVASDGLLTSTPATVTLILPAPMDLNTNGLPDAWETQYFTNLLTDAGRGDADGDGQTDLSEYLSQTHPRDSNSVLRLILLESASGWPAIRWNAAGGSRYRLEYADQLDPDHPQTGFQAIARPLAAELAPAEPGTFATLEFEDTFTWTPSPGTNALRLYRVKVLGE